MLKFIAKYLVKLIIFWLIVFAFARFFFLSYNHNALQLISIKDILFVFIAAIRLDISTISYFMAITFICLLLYSILRKKVILTINTVFTLIILFCIAIINAVDPILFNEWGVKFNFKALTYVGNPTEVFNSARLSVICIGLCFILLQFALFAFIYIRFIHKNKITIPQRSYLISGLFFLIMPVLIVLGIRGGVQQIPINQSDAYFSNQLVLNSAAVNPFWNLGQSIVQNNDYYDTNPYSYYKLQDATSIVESLHYVEKDTSIFLFSTPKPNIVFVILEGWSADVVGALNGIPKLTPRFDELCKQGYLFTSCYATGTLSDQGIVALFSGFPAQPTTRIIRQPDKFVKLPCISHQLKNDGYYTSFYFGGELNYGNIKGYLYFNNFDKIIEGKDLPSSWPHNKLGYHDGYVLSHHIKEINAFKQPFFTSVFTLSSHSPYEQPMKQKFNNGGDENEYINAIYYADSCIGNYMTQAKKQAWYKNTIFIFMSDHSHPNPMQRYYYEPAQRRIPFLIYGEPLKAEFKGQQHQQIVSQIDFATTLLKQLKLQTTQFKWSKNAMNPNTKPFAYYAFTDGLGWVTPSYNFAFEHQVKQFNVSQRISNSADSTQIIKSGKSYLQVLFETYLGY